MQKITDSHVEIIKKVNLVDYLKKMEGLTFSEYLPEYFICNEDNGVILRDNVYYYAKSAKNIEDIISFIQYFNDTDYDEAMKKLLEYLSLLLP